MSTVCLAIIDFLISKKKKKISHIAFPSTTMLLDLYSRNPLLVVLTFFFNGDEVVD